MAPATEMQIKIAPSRTALMVIDMQNDFCAEGGYVERIGKNAAPCRAVAPIVTVLADAARAAHVPVVWVFANYADERVVPAMLRRKREMGIELPCCTPGSWGAAPFGVQPLPGERIFEKHSYSLFSNPNAEASLKKAGIDTLVFTGVQTNVCVESSLRDAHSRGFFVVIVQDGVASHSAKLHEATLMNVGSLWGDVLTSAQVLSVWGSAGRHSSPTESTT